MAKIFVSFNVVTTSDIIIVARESDNLLAEVWRSEVYEPPHSQRNFTILDVNPVMHQVQVWSTVDGVTLGQLKNACDIDASLGTGTAFEMIQIIVGRGNGAPHYDPAPGATQYVNPDLDGKDYAVFKPGYGPLIWDYHIDKIEGGGWEYIDGQTVGEAGDEYTIMHSNLVQTRETETVKGYPMAIVSIAANTVFSDAHYGRMMEVAGTGIVEMEIENFNEIPDGTTFGFNTHGGTQRNLSLILPDTFYALVAGEERNPVYIGRAETVQFLKQGLYLRVVNWDGDYLRVGQTIQQNSAPAPINSLPKTGGWVLKTDYPRLFNWYVLELPADEIFTDLAETNPASAANKGKWGIGTTKFWVPDSRGRFNRASDGVKKAGTLYAAIVGPHWHSLGTQNISSVPSFNRAPAHNVRSWNATGQTDIGSLASTDFNQDPTAPYAYSTENVPEHIIVNEFIIT